VGTFDPAELDVYGFISILPVFSITYRSKPKLAQVSLFSLLRRSLLVPERHPGRPGHSGPGALRARHQPLREGAVIMGEPAKAFWVEEEVLSEVEQEMEFEDISLISTGISDDCWRLGSD